MPRVGVPQLGGRPLFGLAVPDAQRPEQAVEVLMVGAHERGIGVGVRRVLVAVTAVEGEDLLVSLD